MVDRENKKGIRVPHKVIGKLSKLVRLIGIPEGVKPNYLKLRIPVHVSIGIW
jgi:hypothetical protein